MDAKKLREIADRANLTKAEDFWKAYSINLFEQLNREAQGGNTAYKITDKDHNGLNPHGWLSCPMLYKKAIVELRALGYDVVHCDSVRDGTYMLIKW